MKILPLKNDDFGATRCGTTKQQRSAFIYKLKILQLKMKMLQ